jgi:hypothetical protein
MTTIISVKKNGSGFHDVETRSNGYIPEGFLFVPPELTDMLNGGWCALTVKKGALTDVVPGERPVKEEDGE